MCISHGYVQEGDKGPVLGLIATLTFLEAVSLLSASEYNGSHSPASDLSSDEGNLHPTLNFSTYMSQLKVWDIIALNPF